MDEPSHNHHPRIRRFNGATLLAALLAAALVGVGVGTGRWSQGSGPARVTGDALGVLGGDCATSQATSQFPAPAAPAARDGAGASLDLGLLSVLAPRRFGRSTPDSRSASLADSAHVRTYNGRPLRRVGVLRMKVTAYSPDERSCGASADGITASGYSVLANGGFLVAADPRVLPLGSLVSVPGYDGGAVVPVLDTGGAIKGHRLDVLYPTHEVAMEWGIQELDVEVWDYADGLPNGFRRVRRPAK
jgi:3D (Asp-Asp-Asp) domain-containing protein